MKNKISILVACMAFSSSAYSEDEGFSLVASAGGEYDSNITVDEVDVTSDKGDIAALLDLSVSYKTKAVENFTLEFGYDFSQSLYSEESQFDLQSHALSFNADTEVSGVDLGLAYGFYNTSLGGDKFMDMHMVSPNAAIFFGDGSYLRADYSYFKKSFTIQEARNADTHSFGASLYQFMDDGSFFNFGLKHERENTVSDEFDYVGWVGLVGYQKKVDLAGKETKFSLSVEYQTRKYENITESIGEKRDDKRTTVSASVIYPVFKSFTIKPEYRFVSAQSNFDSADYDEHTIGAVVGYAF